MFHQSPTQHTRVRCVLHYMVWKINRSTNYSSVKFWGTFVKLGWAWGSPKRIHSHTVPPFLALFCNFSFILAIHFSVKHRTWEAALSSFLYRCGQLSCFLLWSGRWDQTGNFLDACIWAKMVVPVKSVLILSSVLSQLWFCFWGLAAEYFWRTGRWLWFPDKVKKARCCWHTSDPSLSPGFLPRGS